MAAFKDLKALHFERSPRGAFVFAPPTMHVIRVESFNSCTGQGVDNEVSIDTKVSNTTPAVVTLTLNSSKNLPLSNFEL